MDGGGGALGAPLNVLVIDRSLRDHVWTDVLCLPSPVAVSDPSCGTPSHFIGQSGRVEQMRRSPAVKSPDHRK